MMFYKFLTMCTFSLGMVVMQSSYSMIKITNSIDTKNIFLERGENPDVAVEENSKTKLSPKELRNAVLSLEQLNVYLLSYGVNDQDEAGSTLLHHAVSVGNLEVVKYLLSNHNAIKNIINTFGKTPQHYALFHFDVTNNSRFKEIASLLD